MTYSCLLGFTVEFEDGDGVDLLTGEYGTVVKAENADEAVERSRKILETRLMLPKGAETSTVELTSIEVKLS